MPTVEQSKLTPEQRKTRASIAALTRWSKESGAEQAARGQAGLYAKFLREVDPNNELPEDERNRRADRAYRAHMKRIRYAQSKSDTA